jgi:hypothetical protein
MNNDLKSILVGYGFGSLATSCHLPTKLKPNGSLVGRPAIGHAQVIRPLTV